MRPVSLFPLPLNLLLSLLPPFLHRLRLLAFVQRCLHPPDPGHPLPLSWPVRSTPAGSRRAEYLGGSLLRRLRHWHGINAEFLADMSEFFRIGEAAIRHHPA